MRFKPYLTYRTLHTDNRSGFDQVIRLGVDGPITDQLHLDANAGYYYRAANGAQRFLWRLALHHTAGPYTRESLIAGSYLSDFHEELTQHVTYRINQVLGPKMLGQAFASYAHVEDLEEGVETRDEWRLGVNFSRVLGPKTRMQLGGTYADLNGGSFGHTTAWTGRFELSYHFTDTLLARLLYQFHERDRESDRRDRSYYENIVFLSVTKYFD